MASSAVASMDTDQVRTKKSRNNSRKALKQKNSSTNAANILAQTVSDSPVPSPLGSDPFKENHESLSQPRSEPKKAAKGKSKQAAAKKQDSLEKDLLEMQEMLEKMKLEKEKTEELLKEKDEILKLKEEELEVKGKEQEKLQVELKKLQKTKEFKPNMVRFRLSSVK